MLPTVRLQAVGQILQLLPAGVRPLEQRVARVVRKLHGVHEVGIEPQCLQRKYGGSVAHATWPRQN